ncbi:hypothetical protein EVAR_67711_1 [Eumeta japonica]|uniref:Uncharacterized protein n=1 Tax=Eumeta variegata TaxID=151549 RepID=A0A4C2A185_EUMVA|nr:hypothetical protein EVAR_67711_1 [Eumeta japonica]
MNPFKRGRTNLIYDLREGGPSMATIQDNIAQWVFPLEKLHTKVKRGQDVGKKMVASFFGSISYSATIVVEEKKVAVDWNPNNCVTLVFEKVQKNELAIAFSFIMTTPQHIPPDKQLTIWECLVYKYWLIYPTAPVSH